MTTTTTTTTATTKTTKIEANQSEPSPASGCAVKRKRLSRKERKDRKKQKSAPSTTTPSAPPAPSQDCLSCAVETADEEVDFLANYIPTPMSKALKTTAKSSSLGKWFPKGRVLKPAPSLNKASTTTTTKTTTSHNAESSLVLFYQYLPVSKLWSTSRVDALMDYLQSVFEHLDQGLGGRIRVAREGVNATISATGSTNADLTAAHRIRHFCQDLIQFDPIFQETDFKYIDHLPADRHFKDLKILPVQELVFYGGTTTAAAAEPPSSKRQQEEKHKQQQQQRQQQDSSSSTIDGKLANDAAAKEEGAKHVDAIEFHRLLQEDDAVVIDVRNHYEAAIGRFAPPPAVVAATSTTAAASDSDDDEDDDDDEDGTKKKKKHTKQVVVEKYIDPKMRKSTDWIPWLQQPSTQEQLRNKKVLMYCTGGIRCEKASVYLEEAVGKDVQGIYQLKGGIERYMKTFAEQGGGFWKGHNFVFDKREAVSADQPEGVGGVYRKPAEGKDAAAVLPTMYCCLCQKPWDRYLGKKKCDTCGVPVLMCDACLTHHSAKSKKKQTGDESAGATTSSMPLARCPLCVEENITVPAAMVEFTDNGKKIGKWVDPGDPEGGGRSLMAPTAEERKSTKQDGDAATPAQKVAPSVLKWGGGHASEKKVMRRMKRKQCRFGVDCVRKDCFFAHPERPSAAGGKATS